MSFLPNISYPEIEKPKLARLEGLFGDWNQHFVQNASSLEKHTADDMVYDGFYPYYFTQKKRILFVGRESRQISGLNNMEVLYRAYRDGKFIGAQHLDENNFHRRMIKVAFGLMNGMPPWQEIPDASEIGNSFGDETGLSFAFTNVSKLSNESAGSAADWPVINAAYSLSTQGRNFVQEEISILEPDVIITMNLMDHLEDGLDSLGKWDRIDTSKRAIHLWWLGIGSHRSLVLETWHFSAWKDKDDNADYYAPICDAIQRCESLQRTTL
jgi:hypothetical protein